MEMIMGDSRADAAEYAEDMAELVKAVEDSYVLKRLIFAYHTLLGLNEIPLKRDQFDIIDYARDGIGSVIKDHAFLHYGRISLAVLYSELIRLKKPIDSWGDL